MARTGRPPLPDDELRRHRLAVFLTEGEWRKLTELAGKLNSDIGAAARTLVVDGLRREDRRKR